MGTSVNLLVFSSFQLRFQCVSLLLLHDSNGVLRKYKGNVLKNWKRQVKWPKYPSAAPLRVRTSLSIVFVTKYWNLVWILYRALYIYIIKKPIGFHMEKSWFFHLKFVQILSACYLFHFLRAMMFFKNHINNDFIIFLNLS